MRSRTTIKKIRNEKIQSVIINPKAKNTTKIGYSRVSTKDQQLNRQTAALEAAGCYRIYSERISGKNMERPQLNAMLNYIRDGDTVIVVSLDRLSRNYRDIQSIVENIKSKGAKLEVIDLPQTHTGNQLVDTFMLDMMINLMGFVAENERNKIRERQAQGIAIAKKKGRYNGRPKLYSDDSAQVQAVLDEYKNNTSQYSMKQLAERHGMSRSSLYRVLKRNHLK